MCGAIVTAPLDVVKTRLQSNLFQKQAAAEGTILHRHGVRGLLWNFVDTGKIIRSVWHLFQSLQSCFPLGGTLAGCAVEGSDLTRRLVFTATFTCTKVPVRSSKVSVRLWQAQFPHGSFAPNSLFFLHPC